MQGSSLYQDNVWQLSTFLGSKALIDSSLRNTMVGLGAKLCLSSSFIHCQSKLAGNVKIDKTACLNYFWSET